MSERKRITVVCSVLLVLCLAGSMVTLRRVDALRAGATLEEVLYITSPQTIRRMSLGYDGLMADIYWTRVVQYFGRQHQVRSRSNRYDLLLPLLDITVTLDPHLIVAYEFGSFFLSQQPPEGAGKPDEAVAFVERGIRENPDNWRLYYHLGFIHYLERHDYKAAADAFLRGSKVPNAHPWLRTMAAAMAEYGGETRTARFLWEHIYESSTDQNIRNNAVKHLWALEVDEMVPALEARVQLYRQKTGHLPASFQEMIAAGYLRGLPRDPLGYPYKLMPDGRVEVQSPDDLPFITKGLPAGEKPSFLYVPPNDRKQEDSREK
jgi:tetratricopeptide (TPR) repeat protein